MLFAPRKSDAQRRKENLFTPSNQFAGRPRSIVLLDQRRLPGEVSVPHVYRLSRAGAGHKATWSFCGAPAIGVAAAMGMALGVDPVEIEATLEEMRVEFASIWRDLCAYAPDGRRSILGHQAFPAAFLRELRAPRGKWCARRHRCRPLSDPEPHWSKRRKMCIRSAAKPTSASGRFGVPSLCPKADAP